MDLRQRIHPQKYPFSVIQDLIDKLYRKSVYTKLDLKDGFHQISIHPESIKYFSFATPSGQYEFLKLPFGYSEFSAEFQKRIMDIFKDIIRQEKVSVYVDDILIATSSVEENLKILESILILLKQYNIELNLSKCLFLKKIKYLGYSISSEGVTLTPRHVQAMLDYPIPKSAKQLCGFLGLCSYFRRLKIML